MIVKSILFFILLFALSFENLAHDRSDTLLLISRLYGVSWLLEENEEICERLIESSLNSSGKQQNFDPDQIVSEMLPKKPPADYREIDTTEHLLVARHRRLINHPFLNQLSRQKLASIILRKNHGRKVIWKEVQVLDYKDNPPLDDLTPYHCLKSFFHFWNSIEYYYPYKELMDRDWDAVFLEYIKVFTSDSIVQAKVYKRNFKRLLTELNDGHASMGRLYDPKLYRQQKRSHRKNQRKEKKKAKQKQSRTDSLNRAEANRDKPAVEQHMIKYLPVDLKSRNKRLYVLRKMAVDQCKDIDVGDEVISINGVSVAQIVQHQSEYIPVSRPELIYHELDKSRKWLSLFGSDSISLHMANGETHFLYAREMTRSAFYELLGYDRETGQSDRDDFIYLSMDEVERKNYIGKLRRSVKAGLPLIVDCRNYPRKLFTLQIVKYLSRKPRAVADLFIPLKHYPGIYKKKIGQSFYATNMLDLVLKSFWVIPPQWNLFYSFTGIMDQPILVLMNENTKSWGESMVMLIKAYGDDVVLIGRNTNGANGNIGIVEIAGRKELSFTRLILQEPNGTNYQGQGIPPDIYVNQSNPTSNQLNQDEIFQAALDYLDELKTAVDENSKTTP